MAGGLCFSLVLLFYGWLKASVWADCCSHPGIPLTTDNRVLSDTLCHLLSTLNLSTSKIMDLNGTYFINNIMIKAATTSNASIDVDIVDTSCGPFFDKTCYIRCSSRSVEQTSGCYETMNVTCDDDSVKGQYVRIRQNNGAALVLCDVNITGRPDPLTNFALHAPCNQSSTYNTGWSADKAVDGNRNGTRDAMSCSHTMVVSVNNTEEIHWWQVDLRRLILVSHIVIANRLDSCCTQRLANFTVELGRLESNDNITYTLCRYFDGVAGPLTTLNCTMSIWGRFVRISKTGETLTLCEVEVYGDTDDSSTGDFSALTNFALHAPCNQSSTYNTGWPAKAVDGNRNGTWDAMSCSHTMVVNVNNTEQIHWWQVDLRRLILVSHIVIANRLDSCCTQRLANFTVELGRLESNDNITYTLCRYFDGVAGPLTTLNCTMSIWGQFVRISKTGEILTLCEVEVYGDTDDSSTGDFSEMSRIPTDFSCDDLSLSTSLATPQITTAVATSTIPPTEATTFEMFSEDTSIAQVSTVNPQVSTETPQVSSEAKVSTVISQVLSEAEVSTVNPQVSSEAQVSSVIPQVSSEAQVSTVNPQVSSEAQVSSVIPQVSSEAKVSTVNPQVSSEAQVSTVIPQVSSEAQVSTDIPQVLSETQVSTVIPQDSSEAQVSTVNPEAMTEARSSTEGSVTFAIPVEHNNCMCTCWNAMTKKSREEVQEDMRQTAKVLKVQRSNVGQQIRKKSSVSDHRPSSSVMGVACSIAIASIFGAIVLCDICHLCNNFWKKKGRKESKTQERDMHGP